MSSPLPGAAPGEGAAVEVAVQDAAGTRTAREGGAARVELCSGLDLGGLTPSAGVVEAAVAAWGPAGAETSSRTGVHVLVRPRPGGFVLHRGDAEVVVRDAVVAVRAGAAGVVVGALEADGGLDESVLRAVLDAVRGERAGAAVTFHRAVDAAADPAAVVERLAELGVDRALTSGGADDALTGAAVIAGLVRAAGGRLAVMAGGGVRATAVRELVQRTGVRDVHLSARRLVVPDTGFGAEHETDGELVRAAVAAAGTAAALAR